MPERFLPTDPAQRPRVRRATVRVLLVSGDDRLLLFHDHDPLVGTGWWATPGGGIEAGESEVAAVVRELAEETGYAVAPEQVRGPVARRAVRHGYADVVVDQHDTFYAVHVPRFEVDTAGHTEGERRTVLGHRWWRWVELAATSEVIRPAGLPALWQLLDAPQRWPVQLPAAEESSVGAQPETDTH